MCLFEVDVFEKDVPAIKNLVSGTDFITKKANCQALALQDDYSLIC